MGNCQKQENQQDQQTNEQGPVQSIRISNFVWNKDYQGLFDYDSKSIQKKVIKIKGDAILIKFTNKIEIADDKISDLNEQQLKNSLFRIICKPNFYQIHPIYIEGQSFTLQKILWLVVASLPNKRHVLQERDILKFGKQKIKVREIVLSNMNTSTVPENNIKLSKTVYQDLTFKNVIPKSQLMIQTEHKQTHSEVTVSEQVCRICLQPGQYDNPLITPCKCSGSVKYIHLNCLKLWLAKRLSVVKNQYCITINWLPLSCQMCKTGFRYRIYMDNKKFYTVDIPKPPKPYIILELMRKQSSTKGKVFHFISFATKNKINIGRKKDIDVKISQDISISRCHATIEYLEEENKFVLSDNKSKFGTLVLAKRGMIANPKFPGISVQIGAEVFSFDSLRGDSQEKFEPKDRDPNQYFVEDDFQVDDDSQEESEGAQSINDLEGNQGDLQQSASPQIRNRPSIESRAD